MALERRPQTQASLINLLTSRSFTPGSARHGWANPGTVGLPGQTRPSFRAAGHEYSEGTLRRQCGSFVHDFLDVHCFSVLSAVFEDLESSGTQLRVDLFTSLKFLIVWILILLADFILELRFEYLWPGWLFVKGVYNSSRYQGLATSLLFLCAAFTSDVCCFIFVPVHWLFFIASTYVWIQYLWNSERGICLSTLSLWILFIYIEATFRFKNLRNFNADLCRPLAAHCIGYPMVSFGFEFKSYIYHKIKLRKQKEVQNQNTFFMQILQQALPSAEQLKTGQDRTFDKASKGLSLWSLYQQENKSFEMGKKYSLVLPELEYKERGKEIEVLKQTLAATNCLQATDSRMSEPECVENHFIKTMGYESFGSTENLCHDDLCAETSKACKQKSPKVLGASNGNVIFAKVEKKQKYSSKSTSTRKMIYENGSLNHQNSKPEAVLRYISSGPGKRLENDIKKLKADLQASRQYEHELRNQVNILTNSKQEVRSELVQLRQENELLQTRMHCALQVKQKDKQNIAYLEKKLRAELEGHVLLEKQLMDTKRRKNDDASVLTRAVSLSTSNRGDCTDTLKNRMKEMDTEYKQLQTELKMKDEHLRKAEQEVRELCRYKENDQDTDMLMAALSAMQDKTQHLETNLSAETRIKLDLFSALGDARRQLEIAQGHIIQQDQEIEELKQKVAEVMAVMPGITYSVASTLSTANSHYSSKFVETGNSGLDPNPLMYQPLKK
ncbi:macoilin-like [Narcine bancroftii]|uniref:macoilin-like n=1 Tax=Narcine bancroftii TaxID=1343680 RepID=UPI003832258E